MRTGSAIYRLLVNTGYLPYSCTRVIRSELRFRPDAQWTISDSPVSVTEKLTILPGATLTIGAGVSVLLAENAAILVEGSLLANGTVTDPILFTRAAGSNSWPGIEFSGTRVWNTFPSNSVFEALPF